MKIRIKDFRLKKHLTQTGLATAVECSQNLISRMESGTADPKASILLRLADYFHVSLDYIFGRTDNPQGKLYEYKPKIQQNDPKMQKFVEMCFDPASPMNARLKETLLQMLGEAKQ